MITFRERNEIVAVKRRENRIKSMKTGVACDTCGTELFRLLSDDDRKFWKMGYPTLGRSECVYCAGCGFQGIMEMMPLTPTLSNDWD